MQIKKFSSTEGKKYIEKFICVWRNETVSVDEITLAPLILNNQVYCSQS